MRTKTIHIKKNQIIFEEGDDSQGIYLIKFGHVVVTKKLGEERFVIGDLKGGDILGSIGVFTSQPRYATAQAVEDTVVEYTEGALMTKTLPTWALAILKDLIIRLKSINMDFIDLRIRERQLRKEFEAGNVACASQMCVLLAALMKNGLQDDGGQKIFILQGFLAQAELITSKNFDRLEKVLNAIKSKGLMEFGRNDRVGDFIRNPDLKLLKEFNSFCKNFLAGTNKRSNFIPLKYEKALFVIENYIKKFDENAKISIDDLCKFVEGETKKPFGKADLDVFVKCELLREFPGDPNAVKINSFTISKRFLFEKVVRALEAIDK
jgi:hypothetical protein